MAKKTTIDAILQLYSKLGGNLSDVLGTRSNVNFMGLGKSSEPFLDMDLNIEALGAISKSKALQELKSSVGFATADKLNDVKQINF
jgi:adenine C2-methylase RlmN of 23S rRNA A2503 and tRNA A37